MKDYNFDHAVWVVNEISKRVNTPYMMANEELAVDIFPYICEKFPEAITVKLGIEQWIAVNKRSKNALIRHLKTQKEGHLKSIREIESAIEFII